MNVDATKMINILSNRYSEKVNNLEKEVSYLLAENENLKNQLKEKKENKDKGEG